MFSRFPTRRVAKWERSRPVEKQKREDADANGPFADTILELLGDSVEEPDDDRE